MSAPEQQAAYAAWRFMLWANHGHLTTREIDELVERGVIRPGMTVEDVRAALAASEVKP